MVFIMEEKVFVAENEHPTQDGGKTVLTWDMFRKTLICQNELKFVDRLSELECKEFRKPKGRKRTISHAVDMMINRYLVEEED